MVKALLFQQLAVRALLDDIAVLHDENAVGVADRGKAVRYDKARASLHHTGESVLNFQLGARVNGGRRLVEDQHRRQTEHNAGDAEELLLPLRKLVAVFGKQRVIALREPLDEAVGVRGLGSGDNLLVGRIGLAHNDVFADGALHKPCFLKHHSVILPQAGAGHLPNVAPVHGDAAAGRIVKAHQQVDERRLAAAGGANNGDPVPGAYL